MKFLKHSLMTVVFILIFDFLWLTLQKPMYNSMVKTIQGHDINIRLLSGILAYVFMFIGLLYIVYPTISNEKESDLVSSLKVAGIFGLVVYGIYNTTNYSIFSNYSIIVSIKDTLWGTFVFFISTWFTLKLLGRNFNY